MRQVKCAFCSSTFETLDQRKRFCNSSCAGKYGNKLRAEENAKKPKPPTTPCEGCGTTPETKYASGRFCSEKCARRSSTASNRAETSRKAREKLKARYQQSSESDFITPCEACNKIPDFKWKSGRFCFDCAFSVTGTANSYKKSHSEETKSDLLKERKKQAEKEPKERKKRDYPTLMVDKICPCCSQEFSLPFWKRSRKFCSVACVRRDPARRQASSQKMIERNINGNFFQSFGRRVTYTNYGQNIRCDSLIEWCALEDLFEKHGKEGISSVTRSAARIPYIKDGVEKTYNPDFDVELCDGTKLIIECKSIQSGSNEVWKRYHQESAVKRELLEKFCLEYGIVPVWFTQKTRKDLYKRAVLLPRKEPSENPAPDGVG